MAPDEYGPHNGYRQIINNVRAPLVAELKKSHERIAELEKERDEAIREWKAHRDINNTHWKERNQARRQFGQAIALLRELEWSNHDAYTFDPICPICGAVKPDHAPDCRLAAFLKEGNDGPD